MDSSVMRRRCALAISELSQMSDSPRFASEDPSSVHVPEARQSVSGAWQKLDQGVSQLHFTE